MILGRVVRSSVSAGYAKLQVVMLCNVVVDQMFMDCHGFVQNSNEKEENRKCLCTEWLFLCFSINCPLFRVYLSILCTSRALLDDKVQDVQVSTTCTICAIVSSFLGQDRDKLLSDQKSNFTVIS